LENYEILLSLQDKNQNLFDLKPVGTHMAPLSQDGEHRIQRTLQDVSDKQ
jgi:hypothetical protein